MTVISSFLPEKTRPIPKFNPTFELGGVSIGYVIATSEPADSQVSSPSPVDIYKRQVSILVDIYKRRVSQILELVDIYKRQVSTLSPVDIYKRQVSILIDIYKR